MDIDKKKYGKRLCNETKGIVINVYEQMEENTQHFLDLIRRSHRGRFKIYIGMIAGVDKTFRMLQDAREMLRQGTDVQIGYVETHGRPDTVKALRGLPVIPRKKVFYKGKEIEESNT